MRNEWSYEVALGVVASQLVKTANVVSGAVATRRDGERHPEPAPARWAWSPAPMGWFADPYRRHELRYWDGQRWTEHVSDRGTQTVDQR